MKNHINLIFPHQLFEENPLFSIEGTFLLVEEFLFFRQYAFHKQKIAFHRATMKFYATWLKERGFDVIHLSSYEPESDVRFLADYLNHLGVNSIAYVDPVDDWLEKRIAHLNSFNLTKLNNPSFINTDEDNKSFFKPEKKSFFQTTFYIEQRKKWNILMEKDGKPTGDQWSFDQDNRNKYPKSSTPPPYFQPKTNAYWEEAVSYVQQYFSDNPGEISKEPIYPIDFDDSKHALQDFLGIRFYQFGHFEDAIVQEALVLHHSVLSPMLNVGLISPKTIVNSTLKFAREEGIPINSTEGFIRQIIGWREFIRGMYQCKGIPMRTKNFWGFKRKIPASFYHGTTGILPIDETIKKILKYGYCHHIERLMVLGNFMLLCEFDPDEVYRWFMELFIDAYDWVMVPNVYGMSQFADGGIFATKPYISGSNYLKKMSNYPHGAWEKIWDALFWNFIDQHADFFKKNPRLSMMYHTFQKMTPEKKEEHLMTAHRFLAQL